MNEWQPIKTVKGDVRVLLSDGHYVVIGERIRRTHEIEDDEGRRLTRVTHWMPLPEPPAQEPETP